MKKRPIIRGPIDLSWATKASKLPGKAFHAAIAVRYLSGVKGSKTVTVTRSDRRTFGLERYSLYRGLEHLADAKLVYVDRKSGRAPVVTILEVEDEGF